MKNIRKKISLVTIISVSAVLFLGIICPMTEMKMVKAVNADCLQDQLILSSGTNQMAECMNGKLGFLGTFLVSMPENTLALAVLAVILAYVLRIRLIKEIFCVSYKRVRWRSLYLEYQNIVRVSFLKTFYSWLNVVSRPAHIA